MTNPANLQQSSDVISSDLDHNKNSNITFSSSNTAVASNNRTEDDHLSKDGIKPSQFSIEVLESLSTEGVSFQQDNSVEQYRFEQYLSSKTFSLSPNLTSLLTPAKQQASCSKCGQVGCACSSNQAQPNQQDNNPASSGHNHYHGSTSHTHGLEGDFPVWNTAGTSINIAPSSSLAVGNTFRLHSNPNAQHTIYLDFDGHTTSGTWWNNGGTIRSSAYDRDGNSSSFSTSELLEIQSIWQQVAEDFAPFNVNVTTQDPGAAALSKTSSSDRQWGVRVLFTNNRNDLDGSAIAAGAGGVAYIGSFNRNVDQPVFVFNKGARAAAVTASHEVGHSLYLRHDGISGQTDYHPGHGNGATSWGSIMGAPFQESLTQWSKGDYYNASNKEDDLALITTRNGFGYRSDDHGNSQGNASSLVWNETGKIGAFGIIERNTDVDYFSFTTGAGNVSFTINPASRAFVANGGGSYTTDFLEAQGANLDIWAGLYDSSGTLLESSNPSNLLTASFDLSLAAGTYFIRIDGVGKDNPFTNGSQGYSDYGSLGQYAIQGEIALATITSQIEVQGKTALNLTDIGYQLQHQGEEAQFIRFQNNLVTPNTFAGWSAIAAEKTGNGFQVLWKNASGSYGEWLTDLAGNFQSSTTPTPAELANRETSFQQDLNLDGVIGTSATTIENAGSTRLLYNTLGYQLQHQGEGAQLVRFQNNPVQQNTFAGWSAIAAEKTGNGFQILWKNASGSYGEWLTDLAGNFQSSTTPTPAELANRETSFQQDLNLDGVIGTSATTIENAGSTRLLYNALGYQLQHQGEGAQLIRFQNNPVQQNTFAGWSAIAAEKTGNGFQILWKNASGSYGEWLTDLAGNFQSSTTPTPAELANRETSFQQDLNLDGVIGTSATTIENAGSTRLLYNALGYQLQHQGEGAQLIRFQNNPVQQNTFAGWSAIAAEKTGNGFQILWKNASGSYGEWLTDLAGNFQSSTTPTPAELANRESSFQQDLNLDGVIGGSEPTLATSITNNLIPNSQQQIDSAPLYIPNSEEDDQLIGRIAGAESQDLLVGGLNANSLFSASINQDIDVISDFDVNSDKLLISFSLLDQEQATFSPLTPEQFVLGTSPSIHAPQFLYDIASGQLSYDQDGLGDQAALHFATLTPKPTLSASNLMIAL